MRYNVDLTTPEAVARQLNTVNPAADGVPDAVRDPADAQYAEFWSYVTDQCHAVSAEIMSICNRSFIPYVASQSWRYRDAVYLDGNLWLREDLVSPTSFEIGGVVVDPASYSGIPSDVLPYMYLDFNYSTVSGVSTDWGAGYAIEGTWGYVENLLQAWTTVLASFSCTEGDTDLPMTNANLFETLQYLRCESEMMQVISRTIDNPSTGAGTITVRRGVNGTTAAEHSAKALQKFNVVPAVAQAATQWVSYRYIRRTPIGQTVQLPDGSVVIANGPEGVMKTLANYMRPSAPRSVRARPLWYGR